MFFRRIILIFLLCPLTAIAQSLYPLHPVIGDTLEVIEKRDYSLFPKVSNKALNYCLIYPDSNQLKLKAVYDGDSTATFDLEHSEIVEAQQIIEKVNEYYRSKENTTDDYSRSVVMKKKSSTATSPLLQQGEMNKKAQKDARMQLRIEADRQRIKDHERGLRPNNLHIEFK